MHILSDGFFFSTSAFKILPSPTESESISLLHRFEYQTPIKATSLGLFELHHAVRGRWAARGYGSWNYWVKILMERSQSLWRRSQRLMLMFPMLHLGNTEIFIYLERKLTEHEVQALFQRAYSFIVTPGRWRGRQLPHWWPPCSSNLNCCG